MSITLNWCQDKTKLDIWDKPVFFVTRGGNKHWYLNGELHRENGPALECANGTKYWHLNGQVHRKDGPAIEYVNGGKSWWLYGRRYSESKYWKEMNK